MSRTVWFLYEVGNYKTDMVSLDDVEFRRFEPVNVSDEFFDSVVARAWRYEFESRGSLVTDYEPAPPYSGDLYTGNITAVIPHYRTAYLTGQAVESLKAAYPYLALIVIDDGSNDASTKSVKTLPDRFPATRVMILGRNIGHGAALHRAILEVETPLVLTVDSDIIVHRPGFLELMETRMHREDLYAIGSMYWRDYCHGLMYLTCVFALYNLEVYRSLPPFEHHGDPMRKNMVEAKERGLKVECFPVCDYVTHLEAGTRRFASPDDPEKWDYTGGGA